MLQFYAVVEIPDTSDGIQYQLRLLDFEHTVQQNLTQTFLNDAEKFTSGKHEINFDPGYLKASRGEILVVSGFSLPEHFAEDVRHPTNCEKISATDLNERKVKAVVGAGADEEESTEDEDVVDVAVFKALSGTKVLSEPKGTKAFLLHGDTLVENDDPGFIIPEPVHAVYRKGNLYFQSYDGTKRFLNLDVIYRDASRSDVSRFLEESPVVFEGDTDLYDFADSWSLRRISLIIANPVWERVSVETICERSRSLPVPIDTTPDGKSIVLPSDRRRLRELLKLLNRSIGREVLTDDLIYSGSHVPLNSSINN